VFDGVSVARQCGFLIFRPNSQMEFRPCRLLFSTLFKSKISI